jgi:hypothetical protein
MFNELDTKIDEDLKKYFKELEQQWFDSYLVHFDDTIFFPIFVGIDHEQI